MNIKLYVDDRLADLNDDTDIRLKKEFQDPEELIVEDVSYSYELEIPVTMTNKVIFGFSDTDAVSGKFSRVHNAQLYANEVLVLNGKLIVNEIDNENYKGNLYVPAKKKLTDVLGDRTLQQLIPHNKYINSFSDIDKINCYVGNIQGGTLPPEDQRDNHVCFPYVLYGWPYNKPDVTSDRYWQSLNYADTTFDLNNIFPAYNVLSVLKDIFKTEGYELTGNVFSNPKLNGLYQTYSESADLWKTQKMTPYHLSFSCNYTLCRYEQMISANIVSETAEEFDESGFRFYADNPVWSNNTTFTNIDNKYNMMKRVTVDGYTGSKRVIVIPVSGWYQISSTGTITLPDTTRFSEGVPVNVTGWKSRYDDTSFNRSAWEFQIKKGVPKENVQYYGYNFGLPCAPVEFVDGNVNPSVVWFGTEGNNYLSVDVAVKIMNNEIQRRYGKNGKTTVVKDLSGANVNDFIIGAKWGNQKLIYSPYLPYRRNARNAFMSLYDVSKPPELYNKWQGFVEMFPDITAEYLVLNDYLMHSDNTYGYKTAQVLANEDGMFNFEGYNVLKAGQSGTSTVYSWDTTSNTGAKTYPGQLDNSASSTSNTSGTWNINTCVWLEEGDTIYTELLGAYNNQHDKDDTKETKFGCTNARLNFDFSIGLVNTNEDWRPTSQDPIKTGSELEENQYTDMNLFLPNMKCNEYLNGFLQTFNCRLTMVDDKTYSLDFVDSKPEITKTVPIDDYCHVSDAVFKRISQPSTINYRFKVDTTEEGYVHGNDSPYEGQPQWSFNQPNHTGELILNNPSNTSGDEKKYESIWSYTWLKTIKMSDGALIPVPVISDSKLWGESYTYDSVQREKIPTDKTMRLFYVYNKVDIINQNIPPIEKPNYIRISGEQTFRLLIADSAQWSSRLANGYTQNRSSFLDYDTSRMNTLKGRDKTITDCFLNVNESFKSYECSVECILPIAAYQAIKKGSRVLFNDSLWAVKDIDGFDPSEQEPCNITLISLD